MEDIRILLKERYERGNLDVSKFYEKVTRSNNIRSNNIDSVTYVGQFVRSYRMGSGDGMTLHWDFNNNGTIITVDDDMWGSIGGQELTYFRVVQPTTT